MICYPSRKYREASGELARTKRELEDAQAKISTLQDARDAREAEAAHREAADGAETMDAPDLADGAVKEEPAVAGLHHDIKKEHEDDAVSFLSNFFFFFFKENSN